jgi:DNA-binding CsgD family transcriptional regulator
MALNNLINTRAMPMPLDHASQNLNRFQNDLMTTARMWAVDEVGAAIAHQLNEPLTALLLYLHEIQVAHEHAIDPDRPAESTREMVEKALFETERLCAIVERMNNGIEIPVDADQAIARGRDSIDWFARSGDTKTNGTTQLPTVAGQHPLTPREHEVLSLITSGTSNKEGGRLLGISTRTFEVHRAHIMAKLGARNAADLVRVALSENR